MSSADQDLTIRFFGVRGSIPTPDADKSLYGGNTACVSLQLGQEAPVILDLGTGARLLDLAPVKPLQTADAGPAANILFSHFHWDHIQGFPFLPSLYTAGTRINLYSTLAPQVLEQALRGQMEEPYFPIPYAAIRAQLNYGTIYQGGLQAGSLKVYPFPLNHPGGSSGFRIEAPQGCVVYATDHEHGVAQIDANIEAMCQNADVLIYDSHFTPAEYQSHQGWGHSTWLEGTRLANRSDVKKLVLFHHSPNRTDHDLSQILSEAQAEFQPVEAAQENRSLTLTADSQAV